MQASRFLIAAAALATAATAQFTLVAPQGYDVLEGNSNNIYPWGRNASSMHYLQIQDSSNFTGQGVNAPILISNLQFRVDNGLSAATWAGGSWPNVVIEMSTAAVDHASISTTFAANHGPDRTIVHSGTVTVQPGSRTGGSTTTPGPWHISIPLTTPFLYDPTTGNDLVLDVQLDGTGWTGVSTQCDAVSGATALGSRIWDAATSNGPTASGSAANYCLVCEYTYVPANGLYASFTASPTAAPLNTPVNFTDHSYSSDPGGVLAWAWDVNGDTVVDYTTQNCSHTYTTEGRYDVTLTVVDATHGSVTRTIPQYIAVDEVAASFTTQFLPGSVAVFADTSVGNPTSWAWDVNGDSAVDYTTQNCAHVYPGPGQYNVTLTVTDAISNSSITQSIGIDIIPVPGFGNTYSSTVGTRGFWFQSPTKFSIVSAAVPDETSNGTQNVLIYRMASAPPAYSATATGGLEFAAQGVPSNVPTPCVVSFDAGEYVGVLGACGTATMYNSYATPAGPFASSVLGVPTTLTRFGTQFNINTAASPNTLPYWQEAAGQISRVVLGVTSCAGIPYGDGTPSGVGPAAPRMRCTALPFIGQTTVLSVEQGDNSVIGFMVVGLGRANVPSPYGTILIGNILANSIITPGVVGPGTYTYSWNVPNNAALVGVDVNFQYAQVLLPSNLVALSNAVEMQFAQ